MHPKFTFSACALLASLSLFSCKKNVNCENAEVCVYNNTNEAVHYSWGSSSSYDSILQPGETTCHNVGEVHMNYTLFSSSVHTTYAYFFSEKGDIYEQVEACHTTYDLE